MNLRKIVSMLFVMLFAVMFVSGSELAVDTKWYAGVDAGIGILGSDWEGPVYMTGFDGIIYTDGKSNYGLNKNPFKFDANIGVILPVNVGKFQLGLEYSLDYSPLTGDINVSYPGSHGTTVNYDLSIAGALINNVINIVGNIPTSDKIDLFVSAGFGFYSVSIDPNINWTIVSDLSGRVSSQGADKFSNSESGLSIRIGLGGIYNLNNHWGIKLASYYNEYTGAKFIKNSIDILAGLRYSF